DRAAILGNGKRLEVARALGGVASGSEAVSGRVVSGEWSEAQGLQPLGLDTTHHSPLTTHHSRTTAAEVLPLDVAMARHLEAALRRTRGRIEGPDGAAALLAINPHTLRARMRKLGVDWQSFRPPPRLRESA